MNPDTKLRVISYIIILVVQRISVQLKKKKKRASNLHTLELALEGEEGWRA